MLLPDARPAWAAFNWLLRWADGMGGLSLGDLERYFQKPHPGAWMSQREARDVIGRVEYLIDEDRRLQREKREKEKQQKQT